MKVNIERDINFLKETYRLEIDSCGCCATYKEYPMLPYFDESDSAGISLTDIEETIQSLTDQLSIANDLKLLLMKGL